MHWKATFGKGPTFNLWLDSFPEDLHGGRSVATVWPDDAVPGRWQASVLGDGLVGRWTDPEMARARVFNVLLQKVREALLEIKYTIGPTGRARPRLRGPKLQNVRPVRGAGGSARARVRGAEKS